MNVKGQPIRSCSVKDRMTPTILGWLSTDHLDSTQEGSEKNDMREKVIRSQAFFSANLRSVLLYNTQGAE